MAETPVAHDNPSRLGWFIQKYSGFLSSFLKKFHAERRHWLACCMFGRTCDSECRAKLMQAMLSSYGEAQGDYNDVFIKKQNFCNAESVDSTAGTELNE